MKKEFSKLTIKEWGLKMQKKLDENKLELPNFDVRNLQNEKKDIIIWTKKLYDVHRHDRFMNLVALEERQQNSKQKTTEVEKVKHEN